MSMFTPVGQGGRRPGSRSSWRRVVAVLLVVAMLGAFGVGAYWWYFGGGRDEEIASTALPTSSPSCRTPTVQVPDPLPKRSEVKVEVLNGTDQSGLATQTADALVVLGFEVVAYGNADRSVDGVAVVAFGKGDLAEAVVVASYLPGAQLRPVARETGGVVTVTLGPEFDQLATSAEARDNVAQVVLPTPSPVCT